MNAKNPQSLVGAVTILNLIATGCLAAWLISRNASPTAASAGSVPSTEAVVRVSAEDLRLDALAEPIERLDQRLAGLTTTLQRLNTSSIQFDFLESELEQLAALERGLIVRGRTIEAGRTEENTEQVDEAIAQLGKLVTQVQTERQNRRRTLIALIAGLEKQLAGLSGATLIADKVPEKPAAVEPETVSQDPAPASPSPTSQAEPAGADEASPGTDE